MLKAMGRPEEVESFGGLLGKYESEVFYGFMPDLLNKILEPHGYLYFNIDEDKVMRQQEKLTLSDSDNFLVCQPDTAKKLGLLK